MTTPTDDREAFVTHAPACARCVTAPATGLLCDECRELLMDALQSELEERDDYPDPDGWGVMERARIPWPAEAVARVPWCARKAAAILRKRGWRPRAGNPDGDGPICIFNAIRVAAGDVTKGCDVRGATGDEVRVRLGLSLTQAGALINWNDAQTSAEPVLAVLDAIAATEQEQG